MSQSYLQELGSVTFVAHLELGPEFLDSSLAFEPSFSAWTDSDASPSSVD
jgi:hypothetical protein